MERSAVSFQRTATGRVLKGNDCEYIKLGSITDNDGCTDGKDKELIDDDTNHGDFREQVCDKAGDRSQEAVSDPEWGGHPWVCNQREEISQLHVLYRCYG